VGLSPAKGALDPFVTSPAPILLIAHPGHELLLHGWLQEERPVVVSITDGSGGSSCDRIAYSRAVIESAGASCSAMFGILSDRECYTSILEQDDTVFDTWRLRITNEIIRHSSPVLVCDPLEFYNPMHDLANALGHAAARAAEAKLRRRVDILSYPITRPHPGSEAVTVPLSSKALEQKRTAAKQYAPLAAEVDALDHVLGSAAETLFLDEAFAWPEASPEPVGYELTGRSRIQSGRYSDLITYVDHVAPIARSLLQPFGRLEASS
jgi:hypothetical protein